MTKKLKKDKHKKKNKSKKRATEDIIIDKFKVEGIKELGPEYYSTPRLA